MTAETPPGKGDAPAPDFKRWCLIVAYEGAPYSGWQSQSGGNTVQDHIEAALRQICPEIDRLHGSGRTDRGVSAVGQVAHFDAPSRLFLDAQAWRRALNVRLPATIRIMRCEEAPQGFHARFSATGKTYHYRIFHGEVLPPSLAGRAWHVRKLVNRERFQRQVERFAGWHDFRAFSANRQDGFDAGRLTWRFLREARVEWAPSPQEWNAPGEMATVAFTGNGFLYRMVRFLAGIAVRCAQGKFREEEIARLLRDPGSEKAPWCAPPDGLTLFAVDYDPAHRIRRGTPQELGIEVPPVAP